MTWKLWMTKWDVLLTALTQHLLETLRQITISYQTSWPIPSAMSKNRYLFSNVFLASTHISLVLMLLYCIQKLTDANLIILKIIHCKDSQLILEHIKKQKLYSLMRSVFPVTDHNFIEPMPWRKPTNVHNSLKLQ